ncbi:UNVERIFIED_CONTAM: hypothetical protein FKN15_011016 [Acipenser sinensis]
MSDTPVHNYLPDLLTAKLEDRREAQGKGVCTARGFSDSLHNAYVMNRFPQKTEALQWCFS